MTHHLRQLGATVGRGYVGRRAVCEILGRSGPRVSELCGVRIGHVRLHDPEGVRFRIPESKTETGIREVQISPDLVEVIIEHIDQLRRAGRPTGPNDYLVQNLKGGQMSRQRAAKIVGEAARRASEELTENGLPPLPRITPHSLRRTYISSALLANNFDVKWVMGQLGHADSKMTLDVYAQLEQRVDRSHGTSFDRLIRKAREQIADLAPLDEVATIGPRRRKTVQDRHQTAPPRKVKRRRFAAGSAHGETQIRTGDTTIFSRVLYQLSYLAVGSVSIEIRCYRLARRPRQLLRRAPPSVMQPTALEFLDQRLVGAPQALGDRDLGAPAQLALRAADVQAAVGELAGAQVGELRLDVLARGPAQLAPDAQHVRLDACGDVVGPRSVPMRSAAR